MVTGQVRPRAVGSEVIIGEEALRELEVAGEQQSSKRSGAEGRASEKAREAGRDRWAGQAMSRH